LYIKEFVKLHGLNAVGVLHVGAHKAEEAEEYISCGLASKHPIIWVEAQANLVRNLESQLDSKLHKIYCAVAWDRSGEELTFNVTSKSASSSLFDLGRHLEIYPEIKVDETIAVRTSRLDEVLHPDDEFNFVVLDIQGAELPALIGLGDRLNRVNWIFTEISREALYKGATQFNDLDSFLRDQGFERVFSAWDRKAGWGDAFYVRTQIYSTSVKQKLLIFLSRLTRFARSYIPQPLSPFLVRAKRIVRKIS
jgi:FkbM family methyltransferase